MNRDIGSVGVAGSASYASGTFTVRGSGSDIWGTSDAFHYVYQPWSGDGQIIARVATLQNTNAWAKAGVMIRETLTASSRHAMMVITPSNGAAFQRRVSTGGSTTHTSGGSATAPYWVKLVRGGNGFSGYKSTDGVTWVLVGTSTISMASNVYVGLAVTSHNNAVLTTTTLDNVSVTVGTPQSSVVGEWRILPYTMLINPIHVGLLRTGKVLVVAGSGNDPTVTTYRAAVWDPRTGTISLQSTPWDLFCNGMSYLPDGRVLITGGTLQYSPFYGLRNTTIFNPVSETFTRVQDMAHGRWYPTNTALGDGRTTTFSGVKETGGINKAIEIYDVASGWSPEYVAPWTPPLYPRVHLLPNGKLFFSGWMLNSHLFDPGTLTWTLDVAETNYGAKRTYGSSVLLPLRPSDGYKPRIMIMGGDNPATDTVEVIDLAAPTPSWRYVQSMSAPRIQMNAVILPTGKVLALGGSAKDEDAQTASLAADLFDPATETWSPAGVASYPRLYHSVALLLPDATVWVAGSNPVRGTYERRMEIYSPAYLFAADGSPAPRPAIVSAPTSVGYGATFDVSTPDAADIDSVVLIRPGASTHAFDMEQRLVELTFVPGSGLVTVTAPPTSNLAPPGYYMLFLVNTSGVPSVARFVQLAQTPQTQLPAAPSNLVATAVSSSRIDLRWTDNATSEGGFKIERSTNGSTFAQIATVGANVTTYANTGLSASTTYYYRVRTYNTAGDSAYSNTANATTAAQGTTYYLSDLTWSSMTNGWGPVERDMSNGEKAAGDGRPITLNGTVYAKGLGAHAHSDVRYNLGGACTRFRAAVGVDDEVGSKGSVVFQVWVDGTKLYDSGVMNGSTATKQIDVSVTGKNELKLVVTKGGDNINYDHADWADARVVCD